MKSIYFDLNRVEFLVTTICNARCKHCSVNHKKMKKKNIDKRIAVDLLEKLSTEYELQSVMTFGGEPLLFPEVVFAIHERATTLGIPRRQIITNGFWSKDFDRIERIAKRLADVGVNDILISVDAFHEEYIPLSIVKKVAGELMKTSIQNIKWSPCWLVSEGDDNPYNLRTRRILEELKEFGIKCSSGNIISPQGAALQNLNQYFKTKSSIVGKCTDLPYTDPLDLQTSICFEPDGDVEICRDFKIGNVNEDDILNIIKKYKPYENEYMKIILEEGVEGLQDLAHRKGLKLRDNKFYTLCDRCAYLRAELEGAK